MCISAHMRVYVYVCVCVCPFATVCDRICEIQTWPDGGEDSCGAVGSLSLSDSDRQERTTPPHTHTHPRLHVSILKFLSLLVWDQRDIIDLHFCHQYQFQGS